MNTAICAVIVLYKPETEHVMNFVEVLRRQSRVICVNNGCDVELISRLRKITEVEVIGDGQNIGLAAAQNLGLREAETQGCEFACLFDQDSMPSNTMISDLAESHLKLSEQHGSDKIVVAPNCFDPRNGENYPGTVYYGPFLKRVPIEQKFQSVSFVMASGSFFSLKALDRQFMLDQFFIDYVDLEWCFRLGRNDWSFYIAKDALMDHSVGDHRVRILGRNVSLHSPMRRYYLTRNCMFMVRMKYVPMSFKLRELMLVFLRFLVSLTQSKSKLQHLKYFAKGLFDGLTTRFVP